MNKNKCQSRFTNTLYFPGEKRGYKIQARNDRYLICTKPHFETCLYTIVDIKNKIRGTNNLVFNAYDYCIQEDINDCLRDLAVGKIEISHRNRVPLIIIKIKKAR